MSDLVPSPATGDPGDVLAAAELALGLLDEADTRAANDRANGDANFAAAVEWWRDQLQTLGAEPVAPPAGLWRSIETRLAEPRAADNDDDAIRADTSVRRWRFATGAMTAIAAALVGVIVLRPTRDVPVAPARRLSAPIVASLTGKRGDVVAITFDRDTHALLVTPAVLKPGKGDVELWIIPAGGTKPISMGVVDTGGPSRRDVDRRRAALIVEGATFAVSLEPTGGSRTGNPSGAIVATGKIVRV